MVKTALDVGREVSDYGDSLIALQNMIHAMETGNWYLKQNPLHSFGTYAKPITKAVANNLIKDVKKEISQILYSNDKERIKRINDFEKSQTTSAKN